MTNPDGSTEILKAQQLLVTVSGDPGAQIGSLQSDPSDERLQALVSSSVRGGFRRRLVELLPDQLRQAALLHALLDDLPIVVMLTGQPIYAAGAEPQEVPLGNIDVCAGWRSGGTIAVELEATGKPPLVTGPASGRQDRTDDSIAWHELPLLPVHGTRRMRRLDVRPEPGWIQFEGFFRDSHVAVGGDEFSMHEYTFQGRVDRDQGVLSALEVRARALPWLDCLPAVDSARQLVGRPLAQLRSHILGEMRGTTTCTHLNDTLRGLEDLRCLADWLAAAGPSAGRPWSEG